MSAFQPISPRTALQLLESADMGVDCARLLADLAEAGSVKGYARLVETSVPGKSTIEIRDGRIDRAIWKRIVSEDKIADVYTNGSVRLGDDHHVAGRISVLGIRFDERSVKAAAVEHGPERPSVTYRPKTATKAPDLTPAEIADVAAPVLAVSPAAAVVAPRRVVAPDAVAYSVDDTAALLSLSRGTVYKLMDAGTLESKKVGGRRLVSADSIRALLM